MSQNEITNATEKMTNMDLNGIDFIINEAEKFLKNNFKHFREGKQLDKNLIDSWRISEILKEINFIIDENIDKIPTLGDYFKASSKNTYNTTNFSNTSGKLIKFNYCVQNIIENQIYLAVGHTKENKIFTNKYHEFTQKTKKPKAENLMEIEEDQGEEDDFGCGADYNNTILSERLMLNAIPIPGLTNWASEKFNLETEDVLKKKKILIYEYENQNVKVNDLRLSIGIAYNYSDCIVIHNWLSLDKYLINEIPKKLQINLNSNNNEIKSDKIGVFDFKFAREKLYELLQSIFGDQLLSEYLILSLTSQIMSKVGTNLLGKLSINFISGNDNIKAPNPEKVLFENTIGSTNYTVKETLKIILNNIVLSLVDLRISINTLNQELFVPRFDVETEELNQGILQMIKDSLLLLDEIEMVEGKLGNSGIINVAALKNLIEFQILHYEFPYSKVEIPQECKIITLTENKSLFKCPSLLEVKLLNGFGKFISKNAEEILNSFLNNNTQAFDLFREWFMKIHQEDFTKDFKIENDVSQVLQKDFLENKDMMNADDFDRFLNLTKLYCLSYGKKTMSVDDYKYIKNLELIRKERLN